MTSVFSTDQQSRADGVKSSKTPGCESQNNVSYSSSHSSVPTRIAAGTPFLVIVTWSRVVLAASTSSLS